MAALAEFNPLLTIPHWLSSKTWFCLTHYKEITRVGFAGPVVEPGPRRRPAEPQIVGSNPTRPVSSGGSKIFDSTLGFMPVVRYCRRFLARVVMRLCHVALLGRLVPKT